MTATQIAQTINTLDALFTALEVTARYTRKALTAVWGIAKPTLIILLAVAIVLGFRCYEAGQAFRNWCDRLVEESLQVRIAGYLLGVDTVDTTDTDVPNVPNADAILQEWRDRVGQQMIAKETAELGMTAEEYTLHSVDTWALAEQETQDVDAPDWYKEAVANAANRQTVTDPAILEADEAIVQDLEVDESYDADRIAIWADLSKLGVKQLRRIAKGTDIPQYWNLPKAELIKALAVFATL